MATLPQSDRFPSHEVLELLQEGGMSRIWKARRRGTEELVALKDPLVQALEPEDRRRFVATARAWIALPHHPHIGRAMSLCGTDDHPALEMELVEGDTLERVLEDGALGITRSVEIALPIAEALHAVHSNGLIHRDLKPANVILSATGPKLVDFGIALPAASVMEDSRLTRTGIIVGTPFYMSPEQAGARRNLGPSSDIFVFGLLLYEMITGSLPFGDADSWGVVRRVADPTVTAPKLARTLPEVPPRLNLLVARCLEKDRTLRPPAMERVVEELRRIQRGRMETRAVRLEPASPREASLGSRIVGREETVEACSEALEAAMAGTGGLLLLEGEMGAGKRKIARELAKVAEVRGCQALLGVCSSPSGRSFRPFFRAFTAWARRRDALHRDDLLGTLERLDSSLLGWGDVLASFLHLPGAAPSAPRAEGAGLLEALETFLRALASDRPLVLIIEGLERADEGTLDLLRCLALEIARLPLMVVLTATSAAVADDARLREVGARRLQVDRLDPAESLELVAERYPGLEDDPLLMDRLYHLTDGNPLFLLSILDVLAARGDLSMTSGRWSMSKDSGPLPLPRSLEDFLGGRLRLLEADEREVFDLAALCAGADNTSVDPSVLALCLDRGEEETRRILNRLQMEHRLLQRSGGSYLLVHPLYQRIVREAMDPRLLQAAERRLGHALAAGEGADPSRIAWHLWNGGEHAAAVPFLQRAAERALRSEDNRAAVDLYKLLVEADAESVEAHLGLGQAFRHQGLHHEALGAFGRGVELARAKGRTSQLASALLWEARTLSVTGRIEDARERLQESREIYEDAGDERGRGQCSILEGLLARREGRSTDALAAYHHALEICGGEDRLEVAGIWDCIGSVHVGLGDIEMARSSYEKALALYEEVGNPRLQAHVYNNLGVVLQGTCQYGEALRHLERALELRRTVLDRRGIGATMCHLSYLWFSLGLYPEAEELARRALEILERAGEARVSDACRIHRALALQGLGSVVEAAEELRLAEGAARERGDGDVLVKVLSARLHGQAREQDIASLRATLTELEAAVERVDAARFLPLLDFYRGLAGGESADAARHFRAALDAARTERLGELEWEAAWRLGRVLAEDGDEEGSAEAHAAAAQKIHELAGTLEDPVLEEAYLQEPRRREALHLAERSGWEYRGRTTRPLPRRQGSGS